MRGYADLYILPVPKKNLTAYRKLAQKFGKVVHEHGALEYREFASGRGGVMKGMKPIEKLVKPKKNETVIFSVVGFKDKAHRDRVNRKTMSDPRIKQMMAAKPLFDLKRMSVSGFQTIVEA